MVRTAGVLATSVPLAVLVGLLMPGPAWLGVAWLTPAAAAVCLTLAIGPWLGHTATAAVVAAIWSVTVAGAARMDDMLALVEPAMQILFLALALLGATVVALRYRTLSTPWRQS